MNTKRPSCTSGPVMANRACLVAQLGVTGTLIFVRFPRVSFSFSLFCFVLFFLPFCFLILILIIIIIIILSKLKGTRSA